MAFVLKMNIFILCMKITQNCCKLLFFQYAYYPNLATQNPRRHFRSRRIGYARCVTLHRPPASLTAIHMCCHDRAHLERRNNFKADV